MGKIWFVSDTHFGHRKIIEYCNRPFKDVEEMDSELVRRWNELVKPEDTVYHLGDVALSSKDYWVPLVQSLKGHKILIRGNHDKHTNKTYYDAGFEKLFQHFTSDCLGLETGTTTGVYLRHIPDFDSPRFNRIHLCGHVHTRWTRKGNIINVGVDKWNYAPVSFEELIQAKEDYPDVTPVGALLRDNNKGYYENK